MALTTMQHRAATGATTLPELCFTAESLGFMSYTVQGLGLRLQGFGAQNLKLEDQGLNEPTSFV